jgi:hypothetical protein
MAEPTWDSSSDTSYSHERESSNSTRSASPLPIREGDVKILEGGQTFILTHGEEPKRSTKRRQSSHRREFHNVPSQLPSIFPHYPSLTPLPQLPLPSLPSSSHSTKYTDQVNLQTTILNPRPLQPHLRRLPLHRLLHPLLARPRLLHGPHFSLLLQNNRSLSHDPRLMAGYLFGHHMLSVLRKDVFVLGVTDAVMFGATFVCVCLQKAVWMRWIDWNSRGWILQHVLIPFPFSRFPFPVPLSPFAPFFLNFYVPCILLISILEIVSV